MRKILCLTLLCVLHIAGFAQNTALIKGRITDAATGRPLPEVTVELPYLKMLTLTDTNGTFLFSRVPRGNYDLKVGDRYTLQDPVRIALDISVVDVGDIAVVVHEADISQTMAALSAFSLEENNSGADDEVTGNQSIPGLLSASRDPFLSAAAFTFGSLHYQLRGYKRNQLEVSINAVPMNDAESGFAIWSTWGGLNDVFRNQTGTFGLHAAETGFGGLLGMTQTDASAASQRKQTRITYSFANRSYRHRLMLTYSSGVMDNGWAFSASASRRWAKAGYIPGTFYDSYAYFLAISKKLGKKNFLHFITFGSPTGRGKAMPATAEAMDIAGSHYYNPNWGYLDGAKRNAHINSTFQPIALLNYTFNPDHNTIINIAIAWQQGLTGNSVIDWYNAQDPRPDYYRKLPGYFLNNPAGADSATAADLLEELERNPDQMQVDWSRLYEVNRMNVDPATGEPGSRSLYVIGQDRDDIRKVSFSVNCSKVIEASAKLYTGASVIFQNTESYRKMLDLLGGDYYVNLNQFAERTYVGNSEFNQNDLNHPNAIIKVGDKYQYDYQARFMKSWWWGQGVFTFNRVDFFLATRLSLDVFHREGIYRNGLFPDDSEGKSAQQSFINYAVKGGLTYKIDGRNYLFINGSYTTAPPSFDNTFISPRTRNMVVDRPGSEQLSSMEGGYILHAPYISGRLTGFVTERKDITDIIRFYHEDYRTFVNYVMRPVNTRNLGAEFALQTKISSSIGITVVAAWMQAFYTNRPDISIYRDNDTNTRAESSAAYLKNYFAATGPQSAYTLGWNYRSPKYWYAYINFNYLHRNYVAINPSRRTAEAVDLIEPASEQWSRILEQEQLPGIFTIDIFTGKSFLLSKAMKSLPYGTFLYLNVGVSNILNNKNNLTGGFEQLRYDFNSRNPDRFGNKYFYGIGINYFINLSLKF